MLARIYRWIDDRLQIDSQVEEIINKPIPAHVNWLYCFGGITFSLFIIQVITGVFLALYYVPSPDHAYASVEYITYEIKFGRLVRGIHHWSANLMVISVVVHMLRVFIHGAYKPPREMNWIVGVVLLITTLGFAFTGYLLPWDQKAYSATTVGTRLVETVPLVGEFLASVLRGGREIGSVALVRFFWLHVFMLPGLAIAFLLAHFAMVRRQGISGPL